ncbi:MAG: hypothetical protein ACYC4Q_01270 [Victivallaceae bacterium]
MRKFALILILAAFTFGINPNIFSVSGSHNMSGKARAAMNAMPRGEDDEDSSEAEGSDESEADSDQKESDREAEGEGNATD